MVEFMSQEHVDTMNRLLVDAPTVKEACATLPRPYLLAYRLSGGPEGGDVHWSVLFDKTVTFGLEPVPNADATVVGDWRDMIRMTTAGRRGEVHEADLSVEGDEAVIGIVGPVLETARSIGTIEVDFPDV